MSKDLIQRIEACTAEMERIGADSRHTKSAYALLREAAQALKEPIITRIGESAGKAFVVYLSDGTKVLVARDATTKGPAWLEVKQQARLFPMELVQQPPSH